MRALGPAIVLLLALPARASAPAEAKGLAALVAHRVAASLPAGLALTDVALAEELHVGPSAVVAIEWRAAPRPGPLTVMVVVQDGDRSERLWARLRLAQLRSVIVARRDLEGTHTIAAGDLTLARRPVEDGAGWQMDPAALVGQATLRAVRAGAVIGALDVAAPAPIARGTIINVVVRRPGLSVSTTGVLERAARPGEQAAVRIDEGRRVVIGRLVDDATLEPESVGGQL